MIAETNPSKMDKVKNHIKKNQKAYIVGATCLTVGAAVGAVAVLIRTDPKIIASVSDVSDQAVVVVGNRNTVKPTVVNLIERSTPSKPIHLVGTNLYFNSLNEAARETGHSLSMISRNVNGLIDDVKGDVFELLELAE